MSGMSNNQNTKGYDTTADSSKVILYDESGNVINSSNPLQATAVITGDMNVDTNSVAGMLIGKSGGGDFTAVSAGLGTVITIGTMPYPHTFIADDIISVQQITIAGAVSNTYTRDDATMTVAGGTALTITGATFAADDTFVIYTNIPKVIVDDANTTRTTATQVQPIQNIDATGKVSPAGETVGNAPFAKITDGAETALISISGALKVIEDVVAKSGFLIGKSGGSDFTTIYTSGTTITIGTLPYNHTLLADDIISVIQISVTGVVLNTYTRNDATMTVSGLVLTVAGASFNSNDTFIIYTNIYKIPSIKPLNLILYNNVGTPLTEDETTEGMYIISAAGAGTEYFYLSENFTGEITNVRHLVDEAVTLSVEFQLEIMSAGNWKPLPPYTTGTLAADGTSQEINSSYPLRELIVSGTNARIACTTGGACNIGCQVVASLNIKW